MLTLQTAQTAFDSRGYSKDAVKRLLGWRAAQVPHSCSQRVLPLFGFDPAGDEARSTPSHTAGILLPLLAHGYKWFCFVSFLQESSQLHETLSLRKLTEPPSGVGSDQLLQLVGGSLCFFLLVLFWANPCPPPAPTCKPRPRLRGSSSRTSVHVEPWEMGAHLASTGLSAEDWEHQTNIRHSQRLETIEWEVKVNTCWWSPWVWVVPGADGTRVTGPHVRLAWWIVWIRGAWLGVAVMVVWSLRVTRLGLGGPGIMAGPGLHRVLGYLQRTSSGKEKLKRRHVWEEFSRTIFL